ncbi:glycerate kinase [Corynebacterium atypicum]|uniref:Glycerate kinase n=1 Tax=Corynebacterium atypicum TaxID=191610 RepID=A0ABM5QM76_9CORY|nr:glycerate kinase [Corynebacterium atypicum]AIG63924.1 glycerate kinase [Corynebacterium atypicum]
MNTPSPSPTHRPLRVVVAPDSFKGTFDARRVAELIGRGVTEAAPGSDVTLTPMADGGEGTAACFTGTPVTLPTVTAAGRLTQATYQLDTATRTAFIDVAAASGLPAVAGTPVPLTGDTFGTGVLIADALSRGVGRIVLALGGSATIDAGTGILVALGARLLDSRGVPVPPGGRGLAAIHEIDTAHLNPALAGIELVLLTDVTSPATGPQGAAAVFGPQKGANPDDVRVLEAGLSHACEVFGADPLVPGMGAAGGVPIALTWLGSLLGAGATILPGAPVVADSLGLPELCRTADLLITGEGSLDSQSLSGKVVGHLVELFLSHARSPETGATQAAPAFGVVSGRAQDGIKEELAARLEPAATAIVEQLPQPSDSDESLVAAGRRLTERYLKISTHQG